ncbi:MAG: hypothetical protein ACI4OA_05845 [Selenomonadaceae bacterium]
MEIFNEVVLFIICAVASLPLAMGIGYVAASLYDGVAIHVAAINEIFLIIVMRQLINLHTKRRAVKK